METQCRKVLFPNYSRIKKRNRLKILSCRLYGKNRKTYYQVCFCIPFELSLLLCSATLGRGFHWRDTRAAAPAAASRLLSYCQNPGAPPPSRLAGALTHVVSATETPYCGRLSTTPNSEVASILRCLAPYRGLAWLPSSYLPSLY